MLEKIKDKFLENYFSLILSFLTIFSILKFHDFMEHFRSERVDDKDMYDET